jgi:hypothetical protein
MHSYYADVRMYNYDSMCFGATPHKLCCKCKRLVKKTESKNYFAVAPATNEHTCRCYLPKRSPGQVEEMNE